MSKLTSEIKDVDFSRLSIKESSKNPNIFTINYKHDDGTVKPLLVKTPFIDCNFTGLFFSTDKNGKPIADKDRMTWRAFLTDEIMINKLNELQEVIEKNKSVFVGPVDPKNKKSKDYDVQNILGDNTDKNGTVHQYARFKFRTSSNDPENIETAFFDMKGKNLSITKLKDFESTFRPREFRYRIVFSMYGWKMNSTHIYGVTLSMEQMQIEITSSSTNIKELLKSTSLFEPSGTAEIEVADLSKHIENDNIEDADADDADDADDVDEAADEEETSVSKKSTKKQESEDEEEITVSKKSTKKQESEDEDEDDDEIKPSKKASVTVKTKQVRKKGVVSNA